MKQTRTAIADIEKIPLTFTYVGFRADFLTWIYKKYRYKKRCRRIADIEKIPLLSHYLVTYYSYQPDLYFYYLAPLHLHMH